MRACCAAVDTPSTQSSSSARSDRPRPHQTPHATAQRQGGEIPPHRLREFYRLLEGQVIDDANLFSENLQEWGDYYNYHRPHGALGGQTPYERLRQKAQDPLS
jgi:broad specificity phosphatase PhoE